MRQLITISREYGSGGRLIGRTGGCVFSSRLPAGNPATSMARQGRTGARSGMFTALEKNPAWFRILKMVGPCT